MASDTSFYSTVVLIAVIILIITLVWLGIELSKVGEEKDFPPAAAVCPDYWSQNGTECEIPLNEHPNNKGIFDDNGGILLNSTNTNGFGDTTIDMSNESWKANGTTEKCNKRAWADQFGIVWDGVSNFNKC